MDLLTICYCSFPNQLHSSFPYLYTVGINDKGLRTKEQNTFSKQVAFQSNANHLLVESKGYIKFEVM